MNARILPILLLSVSGIILSSCATIFDPRGCPPKKPYTKAEQDRFLKDLPKAPASIQGLVVDYEKLRDMTDACRRPGLFG